MQSYILEALPGIHGILIGVGVAFFPAFAMFAYQRLQETKDQLDKTILEVETFSTPSNYIGGRENKLIKEDGELDWDGEAKHLLHHAKSIYSYLDYEEKYGMPRDSHMQKPSDEDVSNTCRSLCLMLLYLFVTYPFSGKTMVHVQGVTEKINDKKSLTFDKPRLQEIERRIGFLSWCWNTSNRTLVTLGHQCAEIEKKKIESEVLASFNELIARSPELPEDKKSVFGKHFI